MSKTKKLIISGFILFNFLTMIRVHVPLEHKFFSNAYKPIDAYLSFFSIYQDWLMFAPNPTRLNLYITADIEFEDGSKDTYFFPRPAQMNLFEKYVNGERYRKIVTEGIRNDSHKWMWPDTAKFALRKMRNKHYNKIPLKVHLSRHWSDTPDLNSEFRPHRAEIKDFKSFRFYTYEVI